MIENFGQLSITRNPTIASMLHRIRYIERMGTGIMRMRQAMENAELDIPKFDFESFFKISFKRDELEDGGVNGGVNDDINLSKNARDILDLISNNSRITLIEIAASIVKSENTVLREINKLKQMDIIERIGSDKTGYWKIKKQNNHGG